MVCLWTCGDVGKMVFFQLRAAPAQFSVCGALQICVDLTILGQVWFYRGSRGGPPSVSSRAAVAAVAASPSLRFSAKPSTTV